jgi:hypothetical protein
MNARSGHVVGAVIAVAAIAAPSATATAPDTTVPGGDGTTPPVTAPGGSYDDEFCNTWIVLEQSFASPPEDPAEMAAWYAANAAPLVAEVREHAPEAIAEPVSVYMDAAEQVGTRSDFDVLFTPQFSAAAAAIYPTFDEGCGIPVVEAVATDYAFGGVPDTLAAGPTAFMVHNDSDTGEAHELLLARVNDGVELTLDEILALPEDEIDANVSFVNAAYTPGPDFTAGVIVNVTPGRYVYACGVAQGSVNGADGTGPPHFTMGMAGEFTVG